MTRPHWIEAKIFYRLSRQNTAEMPMQPLYSSDKIDRRLPSSKVSASATELPNSTLQLGVVVTVDLIGAITG